MDITIKIIDNCKDSKFLNIYDTKILIPIRVNTKYTFSTKIIDNIIKTNTVSFEYKFISFNL